jgi:hypothetical protein
MEVSEYGSGGHAWVKMGVLMSMRRFIKEGGEWEVIVEDKLVLGWECILECGCVL